MNANIPTNSCTKAIMPYSEALSAMTCIPYRGEKIGLNSVISGLAMIANPSLTRTLAELDRFEDLDVDNIRKIVRALLIDVEGTLTCDNDFAPEVVEKLREVRAKIPACIYCKDNRNWPIFEQLDFPVARHLPDKSDPRGFIVAVQLHFQSGIYNARPIRTQDVAMAGDNRLTDGACRKVGMQYIHVNRRPGPEKSFSRFVRLLGDGIAGFHRELEKVGQIATRIRPASIAEIETPHPLVKALYERPKKHAPL